LHPNDEPFVFVMVITIAVQLDTNNCMAFADIDQGFACRTLLKVLCKNLHDLFQGTSNQKHSDISKSGECMSLWENN